MAVDAITRGIIINCMRKALGAKCLREARLKRPISGTHSELITDTLRLLVEAQLLDPPRAGRNEYYGFYTEMAAKDENAELIVLLYETYSYLFTQGIIIPKPSPPNYGSFDSWSSFGLTHYGKDWACIDTEPIPEDINGTTAYLKSVIPGLDDVVMQYISEALRAFDRRLTFASAVMLGAASEKLFYLLAAAVASAIQNPAAQKDLLKLFNDTRTLSRLREKIKDILEDNISNGKIPYAIHKDSLDSILSLFTAIRIQRNDAVHPAAGAVDLAQLRLLLLSFPHISRKVYDLMDWLRMNQL